MRLLVIALAVVGALAIYKTYGHLVAEWFSAPTPTLDGPARR